MKKKKTTKTNKDVKYTLISEIKSDKLDKLFELYASDREKARILYFLDKGSFWATRKVLFEEPNGCFRFAIYHKKFGISETNKMYSNESLVESISFNGKRLYWCHRVNRMNYVRDLTYSNIVKLNDVYQETWREGVIKDTSVIDYIYKKFGWLRYIEENEFAHHSSLNKVIIHKLYNIKDFMRNEYKCPYPVANMVHNAMNNYSHHDRITKWTEIRKRLINIENLSEELFTNPLFIDTCKLSQMVNKKVNCSWGMNRMKAEHDKWTKIVTNVMIESEPFKKLRVAKVYRDFAEYSGFELLDTNHDLIFEGKKKNHCVATYVSRVDSGHCGIYRVNGCTLEIVSSTIKGKSSIFINQYMDYNNTPAPTVYLDMVKERIDSFNETYDFEDDFFKDTFEVDNIF